METTIAFDLQEWIEENRESLKPPMGSKFLFHDPQLLIAVVAGPNIRGDFHVTNSPEFFYQITGEMAIEVIEDGERRQVKVGQGDVALLPAMVPHSPQRPAGTIGLIIERHRRPDEADGFHWYCDNCDTKLHESWKWDGQRLRTALELAAEFDGSVDLRTCPSCGQVQEVKTGPRV